jgi:hypothetical protein
VLADHGATTAGHHVRQEEARMTQPRQKPPFRADHVGSLLRPKELFEARDAWHAGRLPYTALRRIEDDYVIAAVGMQESVGLRAVTDGDYRRDDWFLDFVQPGAHARHGARACRSCGVDFLAHREGDGQDAFFRRHRRGRLPLPEVRHHAHAEVLHAGARHVPHRHHEESVEPSVYPIEESGATWRARTATPWATSLARAAPTCRSTT